MTKHSLYFNTIHDSNSGLDLEWRGHRFTLSWDERDLRLVFVAETLAARGFLGRVMCIKKIKNQLHILCSGRTPFRIWLDSQKLGKYFSLPDATVLEVVVSDWPAVEGSTLSPAPRK